MLAMASTVFLLLLQIFAVLVWTEEIHSYPVKRKDTRYLTARTTPLLFNADTYVKKCQTPLKTALLEKNYRNYTIFTQQFLWCILSKYYTLLQPGVLYLPWNRQEKLNYTYLPTTCDMVEIYLKYELPGRVQNILFENHKRICLLEAHLEELTFLRGHPVSKMNHEKFLICARLATEVTNQVDLVDIFDYNTRTTECFFRMLNETLGALLWLPRLRGLHALAPEQRLRGSRYWSPPQPKLSESPREWRTVRFLAGSEISCQPEWKTKIDIDVYHVLTIVFEIIAKHMRSASCTTVANSSQQENTSRLLFGFVDVILHPGYMKARYLCYTYPLIRNDPCVALLRSQPKKRSITESFSMSTWVGVIITLLVHEVAARLEKGRIDFIDLVQTFVTGAFKERQRPLGNFLSLILCLFGLIIVNAFAGVFTSLLAAPSEVAQPQTLEEVDARVSKMYTRIGFNEFFKDIDSDDVIQRLIAKWVTKNRHYVPADLDALDVAVIDTSANLKSLMWLPKFKDQNGRSTLHVVPQCILTPGYLSFLRAKTWPDGDRFDVLSLRLVDGGVVEKHLRMYDFLKKVTERGTSAKDIVKPLPLHVLPEPTILLGCGLTLSLLSFLVEITFARHQRRK